MSISLNDKDEHVFYDKRIDYYIDKYRIAGELVFSVKLPVILSHFNDSYCFVSSEQSFEYDLLKEKRRIIVAGTRNWIRKEIPGYKSLDEMDHFFTSLLIAIEIKKKEINQVISLFKMKNDELSQIARSILQNALEMVLYRYNEKTEGDSFLIPSINECNRIDLSFFINFIGKRYLRCQFITFYPKLMGMSETPIKKLEFEKEIQNWKYFYNKSKYDLSCMRYVDSILASAISIESYAWSRVKNVFKTDREIEEYTTNLVEGEKKHLSATQLMKKLKKDKFLNTTLSSKQLEKKIQLILNPRNDIMHGKRSVDLSWKDNAIIANQYLNDLLSSFENGNQENCNPQGPDNSDLEFEYSEFMRKAVAQETTVRELKIRASEMMGKYPDLEFPKIQYIIALIREQQFESAKKTTIEIIPTISNESAFAIDLAVAYMREKQFQFAIDTLNMVSISDERVITALAFSYFSLYQINPSDNLNSLEEAERIIKTDVHSLPISYVLRYVVFLDIMIARKNDKMTYDLAKRLSSALKTDYLYPIISALFAIKTKDYDSVPYFVNQFFERLENNSYLGIVFDYYELKYDFDAIERYLGSIISICSQIGVSIDNLDSRINRFKGKKQEKREKYYKYDRINYFNSESLKHRNLVYSQLPDILGGYYIYY